MQACHQMHIYLESHLFIDNTAQRGLDRELRLVCICDRRMAQFTCILQDSVPDVIFVALQRFMTNSAPEIRSQTLSALGESYGGLTAKRMLLKVIVPYSNHDRTYTINIYLPVSEAVFIAVSMLPF